jgi:hypothetical protein
MSLRGYARHRRRLRLPGQTLSAVQQAVAYGRILRRPDGRIDPVAADRAWLENTDPGKRPPLTRRRTDDAAELVSAPVAALYDLRKLLAEHVGPLFRLSGSRADVETAFNGVMKLPEILNALEDGMRAAGVPLRAKDMPS